jgi:hypothetical protein
MIVARSKIRREILRHACVAAQLRRASACAPLDDGQERAVRWAKVEAEPDTLYRRARFFVQRLQRRG